MISVVGAKEGVGATTLVSEIAQVLAKNKKVLVVDADPKSVNDLGFIFGRTVKTLSEAKAHLDTELIFSYLSSGYENICLVRLKEEDDGSQFRRLFSKFDHVIVDGLAKKFLQMAHRAVIVTSEDHSSSSRTYDLYKSLRLLGFNPEMLDIFVTKRAARSGYHTLFSDIDVRSIFRSVRDIAEKLLAEDLRETSIELVPDIKALKEKIFACIIASKELQKIISERTSTKVDMEQKIKDVIDEVLIEERATKIENKNELITDIIRNVLGLGPLEEFLADKKITEIMVNGPEQIYIERDGRIELTDKRFNGDAALYSTIDRIVSSVGRRVDESSPVVDARLQDGSRVHVVIPPLSLCGPILTIRKFRENILKMNDLVQKNSLSENMADLMTAMVRGRSNILVAGGTGSGKTTLLNVLSSYIPEDQRIVTIEDSAELKLIQPHVVRLESRPANIEGRGEITIRDLVRASLRMRPDRIIVGECRGSEALDMLQAMNTGHDGSLTTIHANSARDALSRLETLVMFAGFELPVKVIRQQIVSAIDLIVFVARENNGRRKITQISEIRGLEGDIITLQDIYLFEDGEFKETGFRPECLER